MSWSKFKRVMSIWFDFILILLALFIAVCRVEVMIHEKVTVSRVLSVILCGVAAFGLFMDVRRKMT